MKDYKSSLEDCHSALKLNQNEAGIYQLRGLCYKNLGDNEKAESDFAKAKELGLENRTN